MKKFTVCTLLVAFSCLAAISEGSLLGTIQDGGNRLIETQNNDGGWDWPLDDGDPASGSASNTAGTVGMGLLAAYAQTGNTQYLNAAITAGNYVKNVSPPHSTGNGSFMVALSEATGDASFSADVKTEYYDALVAGTYDKNGTLYDTAGYAQYILDIRTSQGYGDLGIWDVGMAAVGAARVGSAQSQLDVFGDKLEVGLNAWEGDYSTGNSSYSVLGLAGGVFGLAAIGQSLDNPISSGNYLNGAQTATELADILVGYQAPGGGFGKYADYPLDPYTGVQPTAYAILALQEVDPVRYAGEISLAVNWLADVQLATGGWGGSFAGASSENNEITGEALWAINAGVPEPTSVLIWAFLGVLGIGWVRPRR